MSNLTLKTNGASFALPQGPFKEEYGPAAEIVKAWVPNYKHVMEVDGWVPPLLKEKAADHDLRRIGDAASKIIDFDCDLVGVTRRVATELCLPPRLMHALLWISVRLSTFGKPDATSLLWIGLIITPRL